MTGSVRESAAGLRARLDQRRDHPSLVGLPGELFAAADLIGGDVALRSSLSDAGQRVEARVGMVTTLFGERLSELAVAVLSDVVAQRWPDPTSMVQAIEELGAQSAFLIAEQQGTLDSVESELFIVSKALSDSAELQMALTDPAVGARGKTALVRGLLEGRAQSQTTDVLSYALAHLAGRRADSVVDRLMDLAAQQRGRSIAEVTVARPLDEEQRTRLAAALSRIHGRAITLNVAVDPAVLGGISVRVGNEVVDATTTTRIEQARRTLVG